MMLTLFYGDCNKNNVPAPPTKTDLIARSGWKFKSATAAGFGDVSSNVPLCYRDNLITFASAGTGTINESANVCSPSSAGSFTWNFQTNETILFMSAILFPGGSQTFNFISVTETELIVSQEVTPPLSMPLLITFTFTH
jgi:hypothetical protein